MGPASSSRSRPRAASLTRPRLALPARLTPPPTRAPWPSMEQRFAPTLPRRDRVTNSSWGPMIPLASPLAISLRLVNALGSTFATTYQIITSPTGGLSGHFTSLPNNSTITVGGQSFRINYTASGRDLDQPLGPGRKLLHWTGATSSNWSAAGNWAENLAPASGDTLIFDTSTPGFAATTTAYAPSNDLNGLTNIAIVINDAPGSSSFTIAGNSLGLVTTAGIGISSTLATGTAATINNNLTLAANTTVNVGLGTLTLAGAIGGGYSLNEAGSPVGTLDLSSANSYSGGTVLTSGTVSIGNNTSLGTGTITLNGGTLAASTSFLHVANPFVVSTLSTIGGGGFLNIDGNGTLNANLRLPTNSGFLTLDGVISGTGGLIEDGFPGNTTLAGTLANTYTGATTIITGDLELNKSAGVNAVVSPVISLAGGSSPTLSLKASNQLNGGVSVTLGIGGTLNTGGFSDKLASLSGIGTVNDTTTTGTGLTVAGNGAMLLTGPVTGSGLFTYNGTGSLTLANGTSSAFTGQLTAAGGSLLLFWPISRQRLPCAGSGERHPRRDGHGQIVPGLKQRDNQPGWERRGGHSLYSLWRHSGLGARRRDVPGRHHRRGAFRSTSVVWGPRQRSICRTRP